MYFTHLFLYDEMMEVTRPSRFSSTLRSLFHFLASLVGSGIKTIFSLLFILLIFGFLGSLPGGEGSPKETYISGKGDDKIVVVPLRGIILNAVDPLTGRGETITPEAVSRILRHLKEDDKVKAVIFDLDSPGGSAVASDRIYEAIVDFRAQSKKPIITLMGDTVASGGYYISAATDRIIANQATITGSIGVIASNYKLIQLFDKLGIKPEVYKKGQYKDILSNVRETTDEEKIMIDAILDDAYTLFLDRVAQGRQMEDVKVKQLANGRIYSGREAMTVGLVDSLGNLEKAITEGKRLAHIKDARVVRLESSNLFNQLFSGFSLGTLLPFIRPMTMTKVWYLMQ